MRVHANLEDVPVVSGTVSVSKSLICSRWSLFSFSGSRSSQSRSRWNPPAYANPLTSALLGNHEDAREGAQTKLGPKSSLRTQKQGVDVSRSTAPSNISEAQVGLAEP